MAQQHASGVSAVAKTAPQVQMESEEKRGKDGRGGEEEKRGGGCVSRSGSEVERRTKNTKKQNKTPARKRW